MTMTEKNAKAMAKIRVAQLRPMAKPRRSPNMAIHVSSRMLSLPAQRERRGSTVQRCLFRVPRAWATKLGCLQMY